MKPDALPSHFEEFREPYDIQLFLDSIPYNPVGECRSPARNLKKADTLLQSAVFLGSDEEGLFKAQEK